MAPNSTPRHVAIQVQGFITMNRSRKGSHRRRRISTKCSKRALKLRRGSAKQPVYAGILVQLSLVSLVQEANEFTIDDAALGVASPLATSVKPTLPWIAVPDPTPTQVDPGNAWQINWLYIGDGKVKCGVKIDRGVLYGGHILRLRNWEKFWSNVECDKNILGYFPIDATVLEGQLRGDFMTILDRDMLRIPPMPIPNRSRFATKYDVCEHFGRISASGFRATKVGSSRFYAMEHVILVWIWPRTASEEPQFYLIRQVSTVLFLEGLILLGCYGGMVRQKEQSLQKVRRQPGLRDSKKCISCST